LHNAVAHMQASPSTQENYDNETYGGEEGEGENTSGYINVLLCLDPQNVLVYVKGYSTTDEQWGTWILTISNFKQQQAPLGTFTFPVPCKLDTNNQPPPPPSPDPSRSSRHHPPPPPTPPPRRSKNPSLIKRDVQTFQQKEVRQQLFRRFGRLALAVDRLSKLAKRAGY